MRSSEVSVTIYCAFHSDLSRCSRAKSTNGFSAETDGLSNQAGVKQSASGTTRDCTWKGSAVIEKAGFFPSLLILSVQ